MRALQEAKQLKALMVALLDTKEDPEAAKKVKGEQLARNGHLHDFLLARDNAKINCVIAHVESKKDTGDYAFVFTDVENSTTISNEDSVGFPQARHQWRRLSARFH